MKCPCSFSTASAADLHGGMIRERELALTQRMSCIMIWQGSAGMLEAVMPMQTKISVSRVRETHKRHEAQ
jgi:hypothetical protein